jgi:uncharacterized membrane-anchored protein YjiN (DUF445 family)
MAPEREDYAEVGSKRRLPSLTVLAIAGCGLVAAGIAAWFGLVALFILKHPGPAN